MSATVAVAGSRPNAANGLNAVAVTGAAPGGMYGSVGAERIGPPRPASLCSESESDMLLVIDCGFGKLLVAMSVRSQWQ